MLVLFTLAIDNRFTIPLPPQCNLYIMNSLQVVIFQQLHSSHRVPIQNSVFITATFSYKYTIILQWYISSYNTSSDKHTSKLRAKHTHEDNVQ